MMVVQEVGGWLEADHFQVHLRTQVLILLFPSAVFIIVSFYVQLAHVSRVTMTHPFNEIRVSRDELFH